jgi:hypothetical protein
LRDQILTGMILGKSGLARLISHEQCFSPEGRVMLNEVKHLAPTRIVLGKRDSSPACSE